jgi:hypothetical protein
MGEVLSMEGDEMRRDDLEKSRRGLRISSGYTPQRMEINICR